MAKKVEKKLPAFQRDNEYGHEESGSLSHSIIELIGKAKEYLDDDACKSIVSFLQGRLNPDGGFRGRSTASDLYYTVFAADSLLALTGNVPVRAMEPFVDGFGDGQDLDFVHLTCLARCRSRLRRMVTDIPIEKRILDNVETYRSSDGGYAMRKGSANASAYACFLALLAYEGFEVKIPAPRELMRSLRSLRLPNGAYMNEPGSEFGNTPATAAAMILGMRVGEPETSVSAGWLLRRCDRHGGFRAAKSAPQPDLLSTATGLLALFMQGSSIDSIREPCINFVESLWDESGGFRGHVADPTPDCEYTFYGLLSLGALTAGVTAE